MPPFSPGRAGGRSRWAVLFGYHAGALPDPVSTRVADVAVVGAGAAGLATAIFARRGDSARSLLLLDGARTPGAKILVSGGSRCNVTNRAVDEADFWGGPRTIVRRILRA